MRIYRKPYNPTRKRTGTPPKAYYAWEKKEIEERKRIHFRIILAMGLPDIVLPKKI